MPKIVKDALLECSKPTAFKTYIAKQGDTNSRFIRATLVDSGNIVEVDTDNTVVISVKRNDGEVKTFACEIDNGKILAPIPNWALELEGYIDCEIAVIDSMQNQKLSSTQFSLSVEKCIATAEDIAQDENYDFLLQLITDVDTAVKSCESATDKATEIYNTVNEKLASGELKGDKGDKGDRGEQGIQGEQGQQGADGKPGLEYLPKAIKYSKLETKMYYADEDAKITCPNSKSLKLYKGAFLLAEKKEIASDFYTASWYLTIIGKCNFNGKEYNYGIHQYNSVSNLIYNSMYLNETELKSLIAQKQEKLTAGTGITITDNNIISYDGTLQYVFGEELPTDPTKIKKNTLYFVYNDNSDEEVEATQNWYDEYIYMFSKDGSVTEGWELIGSTKIDLTGYALKSELPTKTSELTNDSDFISDSAYVHTDNNYTDEDKTKLAGLSNYDDTAVKKSIATKQDKLTTAQLNAISAVSGKQDKLTVGTGLKLENNVLSLDIETATAQTVYGGDTQ